MRCCNKAIPPPEIALAGYQSLSRLKSPRQPDAGVPLDHANLGEAPCELGRRFDIARKRLNALGQGRIRGLARHRGPMHGGRRVDRRVQIIAERGSQRLFVTFVHGNVVDDGRPQAASLERQHLGQGLRLGLEALHAFFGFRRCRPRCLEFRLCNVMRSLRGDRSGFRFGQRRLRAFNRGGQRGIVGAVQRRQLARDSLDFGG